MSSGSTAKLGGLQFTNKAETLAAAGRMITCARVLPMMHFTVARWRSAPEDVIDDIASSDWGKEPLIVRSCFSAEDTADSSLAGHFPSFRWTDGGSALKSAIDGVIAGYGPLASEQEHVLIQPMLRDVAISGVALSRDPNTCSPYIVINYLRGSDTAAVTGGRERAQPRTVFVSHDSGDPPASVRAVVVLVKELEEIFGARPIDLEFAISSDGSLYLFQVRPLVLRSSAMETDAHRKMLGDVARQFDRASGRDPRLLGRRTVFGVMPDWNPAEIIGIRPRPLALSLYRTILTDFVWAEARSSYGYRDVRGTPLLTEFAGMPYVDVRASFNSLVPAEVPDELAERLVEHYVDRLVESPSLHDRIETEIALSCYSFDMETRLGSLRRHGFSPADCDQLRSSLRRLTVRIIDPIDGPFRHDLSRMGALADFRAPPGIGNGPSKLRAILDECRRRGTLPFAGLARAGFVAVQLLDALVAEGCLSENDRAAFMASLDTVSARLRRDFRSLDRGGFLKIYGHLRPGTYDIQSPRYDEAPDRYFDWTRGGHPSGDARAPGFILRAAQRHRISEMLESHGLDCDSTTLFGFMASAINGREYGKFVFTRLLSDALRLIGELGAAHGLTVDDMSHAEIDGIESLSDDPRRIGAALRDSIANGRARYARTMAMALPPMILERGDLWQFEVPSLAPNFITQRRVVAGTAQASHDAPLDGKIVLLRAADPGHDWIFSRGIAGLVTAYGGANSHMAIRCHELQLPAVLGIGEVEYARLCDVKALEIDGANLHLRVIR